VIREVVVHVVDAHYPGRDLPKMARDWLIKSVLGSNVGPRQ